MTNKEDFLVEIGTEELPPKALNKLSAAFSNNIRDRLKKAELKFDSIESFATPRRLAVIVSNLDVKQQDKLVERKGPAIRAAFKEDGCPTQAALGFARSCGTSVDELEKLETENGAWLVFKTMSRGNESKNLLPNIIEESLSQLPIPKRMRWGNKEVQFVRPVHWIIMLLDSSVINCEIMGIQADRKSFGHRFHHPNSLSIAQPKDYPSLLEIEGHVIVNFSKRRSAIEAQIKQVALSIQGNAEIDPSLLDEVTGLVEWPIAVLGSFDAAFLDIPAEALVSAMKGHQKYFHLTKDNKLLPNFITISNIDSKNSDSVIAGNERVIRPRLADAEFFWNTDRKTPLHDELQKLKQVTFQNKLGSVFDKTVRIKKIAFGILESIDEPSLKDTISRGADLIKCDLMTEMVGEFPELQGTMGSYYAKFDGEDDAVATAIYEHYMPRFAGDVLPSSTIGQILSLADKLDTIVGIFSINLIPTGDKDPFGLRRASLGVLRILIEKRLSLDLMHLIKSTANSYSCDVEKTSDTVFDYMMERLKGYYQEKKIRPQTFEAVLSVRPTNPVDFAKRLNSVSEFEKSTASESLSAANKRIGNILRKSDLPSNHVIQENLLVESQEKDLFSLLGKLKDSTKNATSKQDYTTALNLLTQFKDPIDSFFDNVMVMAEDSNIKQNRLILLNEIHGLFGEIADISKL